MLQGKPVALAGTNVAPLPQGLLDHILGESSMFNLENQPAHPTPSPPHWEDGNLLNPSVRTAGRKRVEGREEGMLAGHLLPARPCARCFMLAVTPAPHNNLCYKPIVIDVNTEAQRVEITCPGHMARNRQRHPALPNSDTTGGSDIPSSL